MARNLLSARLLEAKLKAARQEAASRNTRIRIQDGDGLRLEIRPSGGASWQWVYTFDGKKKPYTLGPYPDLSLAAARVQADEARSLLAQGVDPSAAKREVAETQIVERAAGKTVEEIGQEYLADQKRLGRAEVYLRDIERAFNVDLYPTLGKLDARDVGKTEVEETLRRIESRGSHVHLRRFLGWVRRCFDLAARHGVENPWPKGQLVGYLAPARTKNRPSVREARGLAQLLQAIDGWTGSPVSRAALLLHAHTFVRPTELQYADWSSVDQKLKIWTPKVVLGFGEFDHLVPITPQVNALFETLKPLHRQFIVPGFRHGKRISEATLNAALHALGYKDRHCTHGFRSTASTLLREMGWSGDWVEMQLSHGIKNAVEAAYNKAQYWPQRVKMMQCWSDYLTALTDRESGAEDVLPLDWAEGWRSANRSSSQPSISA